VSIRDERVLHIPFEDETVSLVFSNNPPAAKKWADAIKQAAQGNIEGIAQKDAVVEQVSSLAEGARGIATALGGGLAGSIVGSIGAVMTSVAGNAPIDEKKPEPSKTSTSSRMVCLGCHAPLSGQPGREVTCEYCGTTQTL
ncbi:MAG: hypothetical protein Q4F23_06290, partial [Coriobacteriia bacterium]|nr:hypothetical protein [Coriobacteriia bacterium]